MAPDEINNRAVLATMIFFNMIEELGDVLYYWAMLCTAFNLKPSDVIQANQDKLNSRLSRGVMQGSGDDR